MSNLKRSSPHDRVSRRRRAIQSFKRRANSKRRVVDKVADWLTASFGTISFLILNAVFFVAWIIWNSGIFPELPMSDPFPFGFLTMMVSLEAIFLAIIVLISQNRETKIAELREEVELYINTYAESEITKIIHLQTLLLEKNGIDVSHDVELQEMLRNLESDAIEDELQRQLEKD